GSGIESWCHGDDKEIPWGRYRCSLRPAGRPRCRSHDFTSGWQAHRCASGDIARCAPAGSSSMKRLGLAALLAAITLTACVSTSNGRTIDLVAAADSNVKLGFAALNRGDLSRAKETLERAAKQNSKNAEAQFGLGELHARLNQPKEAERHYRNAISLAPDKLEVVNAYAAFLCTSGEVDKGIAQFEKLANNPLYSRQPAAATNAGICLRDQKRHADSVRYFEMALAKQP